MRLYLLFFVLAALATIAAAWTKEDHEIFDLVSAVEATEGKGTTFYSWLDIPSTATLAQINKAYRKKSILLHPDKNPGVKGIHERFARLGVVGTILRNTEGRKRYDFFYKNGVPKWRGTGYYYARFRPGLGTVLVFLTLITSGLQYLVQRLNYSRDLERVERIIRDARLAAWGQKMVPLEGKRKVKVNLGGAPRIDDNGNYVSGKTIEMVVEGDNVYILDESGDLHLLDASSAIPPAITHTWFLAFVSSTFSRLTSRTPSQESEDSSDSAEQEDGAETEDLSDTPRSGSITPSGASEGGETTFRPTRLPTTKAGGRRRKAVKRR
ncbi:hypothetical protein SERLA73DRAFT_177452 [Serpula lacrymans var. lacrymans S7.3]|uniref:J domain-containing protein n=2 Tax=Serpula lacrymans var. lacrymans TaxID=341189 RepID=F8PP01_SERL3|nr:uncharacterized protein SERLADRAFT_461054 [Serpula lacrymans var. lacrymans S7.9]EGO01878.1 hypothetical protein SERLA73DRAFT_177452 [Serpula lacrymans var. lacrymans S7.3]EGO27505.1 hypothetical protein SERLADRAFT_461054 [Serpula lacrymans var. lacrymans S7.9]